jgi:hypothetical protein
MGTEASATPSMGTTRYQVPRDELVRTYWRRVVRRPQYLLSVGFFLALALLALAAGGPMLYTGALLLIYALTRPVVICRMLARAVDRNAMLTSERTVAFDRSGITAAGADWQTQLSWAHFASWTEDARTFYLETGVTTMASPIPKPAMSAEQHAQLRRCLALIAAPDRLGR